MRMYFMHLSVIMWLAWALRTFEMATKPPAPANWVGNDLSSRSLEALRLFGHLLELLCVIRFAR